VLGGYVKVLVKSGSGVLIYTKCNIFVLSIGDIPTKKIKIHKNEKD